MHTRLCNTNECLMRILPASQDHNEAINTCRFCMLRFGYYLFCVTFCQLRVAQSESLITVLISPSWLADGLSLRRVRY